MFSSTNIVPIARLTNGSVKATDRYPAVDVTDTSQAPSGTTKYYTITELQDYLQDQLSIVKWNEVTTTSRVMVPNNGYVTNNVALVTLTMPAVAKFGSILEIAGSGAGGWSASCGAGQSIIIGNVNSSAGGTIASTQKSDSIRLVCIVANLTWTTVGGPQGNISVT